MMIGFFSSKKFRENVNFSLCVWKYNTVNVLEKYTRKHEKKINMKYEFANVYLVRP